MKVGDVIKALRKRDRMTQVELAKLLNVAPTAISAWEGGKNRPLIDKIIHLSEIFNVPVTDFFSELFIEAEANSDSINLPIVGSISYSAKGIEYDQVEGYHSTPKAWLNDNDFFYIRAKGDSMNGARIHDGDILLIQSQSNVENGDIALILIGGELVLKKVFINGDQLVLQSENPKYGPIFVPLSETMIIGKLDRIIIKF